jgi:glycosyltransferase involved in cell wall biosynthesis
MKILFHSVPARIKTGYGVQTKLWSRALREAGHDVVISSIIPAMPTYVDDGFLTLSSGLRACMGNDWIELHTFFQKADLIISCSDTHVYEIDKWKKLPWAAWQVIDSQPLYKEIKKRADICPLNIAMSRFGQEVMKKVGIESTYIPLAYSKEDFFPEDRAVARKQLKECFPDEEIGDRLMIMMNSANMSRPGRKNFGVAFRAFKELKNDKPDAILYCHTDCKGVSGGEDLFEMARMYGLSEKDVIFPPQYQYAMGMLDSKYMRMMYNCSDFFLHTSMGEGFGVPAVEAQACGIPVISPDYSAMGEVVHHGVKLGEACYNTFAYIEGTEWVVLDWRKLYLVLKDAALGNLPGFVKRPVPEIEQYEIGNVMAEHMTPFLEKASRNVENQKRRLMLFGKIQKAMLGFDVDAKKE